jgi:hypothetical protein
MRRSAGFTGIDRKAIDALAASRAAPIHKLKGVRWHRMVVSLTGETPTGETVAMSLAGEPTKAQTRALLALLAKDDE